MKQGVGKREKVWIIITAVIFSFMAILAFAKSIGEFIIRHPALKILALSFLITIGVTIFTEGMHKHVPKAYIYIPMGFALFVEILQMRYEYKKKHEYREAKGGIGKGACKIIGKPCIRISGPVCNTTSEQKIPISFRIKLHVGSP